MKNLKLRVRYYPGEYAAYVLERKKGLFTWDSITVSRVSHYESDAEAKEAALQSMYSYTTIHKKRINLPYTVETVEYSLKKETGEWIRLDQSTELDISL